MATRQKIRILDWPRQVIAPGPDFQLTVISAQHLELLAKPFFDDHQDNVSDHPAFKVIP